MISNLQLEGTSMFLYYLNSSIKNQKFFNFFLSRESYNFKLQSNWVTLLDKITIF